jgi:NAD(P)-dependent dehydrogenase (short-subunit alcohol dehydrogenase family)/acyl carrier protein
VLEEAPERPASDPPRGPQLLVLSAKTASALATAAGNLARHLRAHPEINLADVAYTLQLGRAAFNHRRFLVCHSVADAITGLEEGRGTSAEQVHRNRAAVLNFPDREYTICDELYAAQSIYRGAVDRCRDAGLVNDCAGGETLAATYAMTQQIIDWGVEFELSSEGLGTRAARCVSGFPLQEAVAQLRNGDSPGEPIRATKVSEFVSVEVPKDWTSLLQLFGELWLGGVTVRWSVFWVQRKPRRIPLPTYPFERARYWVDPAPPKPEENSEAERRENITEWFYIPSWRRSSIRTVPFVGSQKWLLFIDDYGVGNALSRWLRDRGHSVVTTRFGPDYVRLDPASYSIRIALRSDYQRLLNDLRSEGELPSRIVHLYLVSPREIDCDEDPEVVRRHLDLGFYSMLALTQALGDAAISNCRITVVSTGVQEVLASDEVVPAKATVLGPCRVIPQEFIGIAANSIDIALPEQDKFNALVGQLGCELQDPTPEPFVALRDQYRWVQTIEQVPLDYRPDTVRLRNKGVYLITGGFGGIGLAMADHLASTMGARLALVGRTPLPPREQWPRILRSGVGETGVARQIRAVQSLEARGAEILLLCADVTDLEQIELAVQKTLARYGALHGVLHTAGIPGVGIIQRKNPDEAARVLAPKVYGTLMLSRALRGTSLDFLVLFSSVASVTGGGPGQADYCAANIFLDAWATRHASDFGFTCSIGWGEWEWDAWSDGLLGFPEEVRAIFIANRQKFGIRFGEGAEVLQRVLGHNLPHVYVQNRDLNLDIEGSRHLAQTLFDHISVTRMSRRYPRPELGISFIEPRNEIEQKIADIWCETLGIEAVGIDDNFFDLGGNSLIGINLVSRLRSRLGLPSLPSLILYQAPSVRALSEQINQPEPTSTVPTFDWKDRAARRHQRLQQMAQQN